MYTGYNYVLSLYDMNVGELEKQLHLVKCMIENQVEQISPDRSYIMQLEHSKMIIELLISQSFKQHINGI